MRYNNLYLLFLFLSIAFRTDQSFADEYTFYVGEVAPFTIVESDGSVRGVAVDVVSEIMKMAGNPIAINDIRSISWARAVEETETKPGTALFCVARTLKRENLFKWVGPIAELNVGLVAKRFPRIVIKDRVDLKRYLIGVVRNSAPAHILESRYGLDGDDMVFLKGDALQFKMLEVGRVDLITQADTAAPSWLKKLNMNQADFEMVHIMEQLQLYIAFNKKTDDGFIEKLQDSLDTLKQKSDEGVSRYDLIYEKFLDQGPISMQ